MQRKLETSKVSRILSTHKRKHSASLLDEDSNIISDNQTFSLPRDADLFDVPIEMCSASDVVSEKDSATIVLANELCSTSEVVGTPIICGLLDVYSRVCIPSQGIASSSRVPRAVRLKAFDFSAIPLAPHYLIVVPSCKICKAKRFHREPPGFCCSSGQVSIAIHSTPPALWNLFTGNSELSKKFKQYVRAYNNMFAFTSFGVKCDSDLCARYNGISTFKAQGQIYHFMNALLPCDKRPRNLQLYFYDTEHEIYNRLQVYDKMNSDVLFLLQVLEQNPYALFFRSLVNVQTLEDCRIVIQRNTCLDQRVFNAPSSSQVAAIWVDNGDSDYFQSRDILVYSKLGIPLRIQYFYGCYDPLQYPLLFSLGESGWHQGIKRMKKNEHISYEVHTLSNVFSNAEEIVQSEATAMVTAQATRSSVSCREYYCFLLQIRPNCTNVLLHCDRLLQQFCVDMYVKLESSRLDFFRHNKKRVRAEVYSGIVDSINIGESRGSKVGRRIILPASFIGGPRDMRRRYLDAMTLVQKYGNLTFFSQ